MISAIRPALVLFGALTLVCGAAYPLAVTAIGGALFPERAAGSIVERDGLPVGSSLIGQSFTSPRYFWGRPSATGTMANNAAGSSGSNQGPNHPALADAVKARIAALRDADPANQALVPVDLVTASASGLDPEISPAAARFQAGRVAAARNMAREEVERLIERHTAEPLAGFLGEPRVHVLALNLALDAHKPQQR